MPSDGPSFVGFPVSYEVARIIETYDDAVISLLFAFLDPVEELFFLSGNSVRPVLQFFFLVIDDAGKGLVVGRIAFFTSSYISGNAVYGVFA